MALMVEMKEERNYFTDMQRYYHHIFKSQNYLETKQKIQDYAFGHSFSESMHPDSMDNIIAAEIEYQENKDNPLYDFTGVVMKYAKTMEQEIGLFAKELFILLVKKDKSIGEMSYDTQNRSSTINALIQGEVAINPNLGTYKYLFRHYKLQSCLETLNPQVRYCITQKIPKYIESIQSIRNICAHTKNPTRQEAQELRGKMLGVPRESMLIEVVATRIELRKAK